jgi:hypothetical protein
MMEDEAVLRGLNRQALKLARVEGGLLPYGRI